MSLSASEDEILASATNTSLHDTLLNNLVIITNGARDRTHIWLSVTDTPKRIALISDRMRVGEGYPIWSCSFNDIKYINYDGLKFTHCTAHVVWHHYQHNSFSLFMKQNEETYNISWNMLLMISNILTTTALPISILHNTNVLQFEEWLASRWDINYKCWSDPWRLGLLIYMVLYQIAYWKGRYFTYRLKIL